MAFCTDCGSELSDNLRFCINCGTAVHNSSWENNNSDIYSDASNKYTQNAETVTHSVSETDTLGYTQIPPSGYPGTHQVYEDSYNNQFDNSSNFEHTGSYSSNALYPDATYPQQTQQKEKSRMGTGSFLGGLLLMCIPIVGLIIMIIWACGSTNPTRASFARAMIIFFIIIVIILVALYFIFKPFFDNLFLMIQLSITGEYGSSIESYNDLFDFFNGYDGGDGNTDIPQNFDEFLDYFGGDGSDVPGDFDDILNFFS